MTAIINTESQRPKWRSVIVFTLAFWLSGSLILDLIIMPSLYSTGMMSEPGFAIAGYSIFWLFNHVELLCAALVLTGVLVLRNIPKNASIATIDSNRRWAIPLCLGLLAIALTYTYGLTPEMSALGLQLNLFEPATEVPTAMNLMHEGYWALELLKLAAGGALIGIAYEQ